MAQQFGFDLSPEDISSASAQTHQQVSPQTGGLDELSYVPWWKRKLLQMQAQDVGQGIQQAHGGGGESVVNNWASLGKGVGNLAKKFIGMADGGAVQGPTMAMIGEGGEPEYVVPESKALPFAMRTLQDGIPPNPANLPRGEHRPPPPVILANTPAMACGGKVIPKMMNGGKVIPYGRPVQAPMEESTDFFSIGQPMPEASFAPDMQAPLPMMARPGALPSRPNIAPSFEQRKRLQELIAQGAPTPKFYDRLFMGEGNGPMDMRPGVAPYSIAGRAAGKIIGSLLPYNKKRDEYQRQIEAAKVGVQNEDAQNAANERLAQLERANRVADAQVASNRATEALRNRQAEALNTPPHPYKDMVEVDEATGRRAGIMPGPDGKYRIYRQNVRIPDATPPPPRNPTAATLAATAADPNATPEQRAAAKEALKLLKPPKTGGGHRESVSDAIARVAQRVISDSTAGGGKTVADAIRNVERFYQNDEEVNRYRPEVVKRLKQMAEAQGEVLPVDEKRLEAIKRGLGITSTPKSQAPAAKPTSKPSAPPSISVGGRSYKVGDQVKVRGGKTVTIKAINQDGTFDAE